MRFLVIYKDKETGKVVSVEDTTKLTAEQLDNFIKKYTSPTKTVSFIKVEEGSLEEYLLNGYKESKDVYFQRLNDMEDALDNLRGEIVSYMDTFEGE